MKTKVRDWMTPRPVTIDATATVLEALQLLKEKRIRRLPVTRRGKLVGLVTDAMLLSCSPGQGAALEAWEVAHLLSTKLVAEVMNPHPHSVAPDTELAECAPLIRDRRLGGGLTVLDDNGNLVGILTTTNALDALMWFSGKYTVREVSTSRGIARKGGAAPQTPDETRSTLHDHEDLEALE